MCLKMPGGWDPETISPFMNPAAHPFNYKTPVRSFLKLLNKSSSTQFPHNSPKSAQHLLPPGCLRWSPFVRVCSCMRCACVCAICVLHTELLYLKGDVCLLAAFHL